METDKMDRLQLQINKNGYAFQYAAIKHIKELNNRGISPWAFEAAEFPVEINGKSIHIDIILRHLHEPFYMTIECKRADPSISDWMFVKAPYISKKNTSDELIVREIIQSRGKSGDAPIGNLQKITRTKDVYRLGFEIKTNQKGDGGAGKGQINEAITQVLRGQNGLIKYFINNLDNNFHIPYRNSNQTNEYIAFMPVIITTANLWINNIPLEDSDLTNGKIELSESNNIQKDWLYFQYAQTPDIKHLNHSVKGNDYISDSLFYDYTRTIAIVKSTGINSFLSAGAWKHPFDWDLVTF